MKKSAIFPAWGRILQGYRPFLAIEITKECPLRCPGCYAYEPQHLNNGHSIRQLTERRGDELVEATLSVIRRLRPLHVSFVGGEPLVRYRELTHLIQGLESLHIEVQVVTSAVCEIPAEWTRFSNLHLVVSVDGLPPEHDVRRAPATYDRILRNIAGHEVIIHCTITPLMLARDDYLAEFAGTWSSCAGVRKIWFSLFTPQMEENPPERLSEQEREVAIGRLGALRTRYPKVDIHELVLRGYAHPPASPQECIFAQTTTCIAADLATQVYPCQIGGRPDCSQCGCIAAAGLAAIGNIKIAGILRISNVFALSRRLGDVLGNRLTA